MSKKFINHPDDCVDEALEGLVMTNLGLRILGEQRVIVHKSVRRLFLKYIIEYLMFRPILVFLLKQIIEL
jgi:hypothetical protein